MKTLNVKLRPEENRVLPLVWLGEKDEKLRIQAVLDQPGSSLKILGLFFGSRHKLELFTDVVHRAPDTFSRTLVRGVLEGNAFVNFEGRIRIEKGAKNTDGDLKGHAMLLSRDARAIMIPRLEVLENEVKAGHGATVGRIDEEQLFYIMSRGLNLEAAKRIIIQGFLSSLLPEFPKAQALKITRAVGI